MIVLVISIAISLLLRAYGRYKIDSALAERIKKVSLNKED